MPARSEGRYRRGGGATNCDATGSHTLTPEASVTTRPNG